MDEASLEIVYKDYCHIGVAVDSEGGLIVPVLRDADKKDLLQLSVDLLALTEKTRQRKISIEELQGGSFTISNQGSIGGGHFTPIIYAPQVAILGVGQGQAKPVAIDGKIAIRTILPLCLPTIIACSTAPTPCAFLKTSSPASKPSRKPTSS